MEVGNNTEWPPGGGRHYPCPAGIEARPGTRGCSGNPGSGSCIRAPAKLAADMGTLPRARVCREHIAKDQEAGSTSPLRPTSCRCLHLAELTRERTPWVHGAWETYSSFRPRQCQRSRMGAESDPLSESPIPGAPQTPQVDMANLLPPVCSLPLVEARPQGAV